jgi:hypothetical protein
MATAQLPDTNIGPAQDDRDHADEHPARISFRQPVSTAGFVDAAWWPRTRDLSAELPSLMEVFWTAAREINRITYNFNVWDRAPRRMTIEGRTVRLGGFATSDPLTVRLSDPWGRERVDVLVIAPGTPDATAARIFSLSSRADSRQRADEIVASVRTGVSTAESTTRS